MNMPSRDDEKRLSFARAYSRGASGKEAAIEAGVPVPSAAVMATKWLKDPHVIELIRGEVNSLVAQLSPLAIRTLRELISSPNTPPSTRLQASRDILDRAGLVPPKRSELDLKVESKSIDMLTRAELEEIVARTKH